MAKSLFVVILPLIVVLSTNNLVLHLYRLTTSPIWITEMLPEVYWADYRSSNDFVKNRLAQGDAVISSMSHTLKYYSDHESDSYLQTYTDRQVFYDISEISGRYLDKYVGSPVIRSISELKDVLNTHRRVWIVAAPYNIFQATSDKPTIEYISKNTKVVYESYESKVLLWER